jgi:hypothetical protein
MCAWAKFALQNNHCSFVADLGEIAAKRATIVVTAAVSKRLIHIGCRHRRQPRRPNLGRKPLDAQARVTTPEGGH